MTCVYIKSALCILHVEKIKSMRRNRLQVTHTPDNSMEEFKYEGQRAVTKLGELDELWEINTNQGVWIADMEDHHARFRWLHEQTWKD